MSKMKVPYFLYNAIVGYWRDGFHIEELYIMYSDVLPNVIDQTVAPYKRVGDNKSKWKPLIFD